jgi:hypothetical protein
VFQNHSPRFSTANSAATYLPQMQVQMFARMDLENLQGTDRPIVQLQVDDCVDNMHGVLGYWERSTLTHLGKAEETRTMSTTL